ncbi:hypothetical protein EV424DRAFT_448808 [Suillus variegatus]|nr:hypothetical protein EV424DRAFT_448808 [Suillus variegatus]
MAPSIVLVAPGEPREGNKPQPLGNFVLIFLFTTSTLCLLYLLWRRASTLRAVVSHQCDHSVEFVLQNLDLHKHRLQTWTRPEGQIRLSEDDGPSATEFLTDGDDEDVGIVDGVILDQDEERPRNEVITLPSIRPGSPS